MCEFERKNQMIKLYLDVAVAHEKYFCHFSIFSQTFFHDDLMDVLYHIRASIYTTNFGENCSHHSAGTGFSDCGVMVFRYPGRSYDFLPDMAMRPCTCRRSIVCFGN